MGLCNIYEYQRLKSIKLSDSYGVQIRINEEDKEPLILYECTSVTLPTIKMKTDVIQYGNNSKVFVYPDYSNIGELELEFLEHYSKENVLCIQNFVNVCLNKLFNDHLFTYKLNDYIHELIIKVYSNNFDYCSIEHVFHHLKLSDYTKYDLDYSSSEIAKWSLKFMFMEYFVRRPHEVEAVSDPGESAPSETVEEIDAVKVAEEAGAAAAAARQQQLSRGRGVETPVQNLEMAEARLENMKSEKPDTGGIKKKQEELAEIQKQKEALTQQLAAADQKVADAEAAHQSNVEAHGKALKHRDDELAGRIDHTGESGAVGTRARLERRDRENANVANAEANRKESYEKVTAAKEERDAVQANVQAEMDRLNAREAEINASINSTYKNIQEYNDAVKTVEDQVNRFKSDYARAKVESMNNDAAYASAQDTYFASQAHNRSDAVKALEADVKRSIVNMDVVDEYMSNSQFAAEQNARKRAQDSLLHDDVMYNFGNEALAEPPVSNNRRPELVELDVLENELDLPSTSETILDNAGISKTTSEIFNFGKNEQSGEMSVTPPLATAEQKQQYREQRQQERLDSIPQLNFSVLSEEKKEDKPAESPKPQEAPNSVNVDDYALKVTEKETSLGTVATFETGEKVNYRTSMPFKSLPESAQQTFTRYIDDVKASNPEISNKELIERAGEWYDKNNVSRSMMGEDDLVVSRLKSLGVLK